MTEKKTMVKYENGMNYMDWGNNVFSMTLPIPTSRIDTPEICIEHLYTDAEIMREIEEDGVKRRLYMGREFDSLGKGDSYFCADRNSCGDGKINIIDGTEKSRVVAMTKNSNINVALPKMRFANMVLSSQPPFDNFCFDNFIPIFKTIKEILSDGKTNAVESSELAETENDVQKDN